MSGDHNENQRYGVPFRFIHDDDESTSPPVRDMLDDVGQICANDAELKRHVILRLLEILHSLGVSGHEAEAMRNGETQ